MVSFYMGVAMWKWLSGKKTVLASVLNSVAIWALAKGYVDEKDAFLVASVLTAITGVALGHKVVKAAKR